ncbi:MAG: CbiX/SirB N-terminal domain-containing protein [Myxococcota bacterium]|nr:CbiX/SirB N-terminal domain-containing protein [Myxococcota bacterium]
MTWNAPQTSVLIVAHGSQINPHSALPAYTHAHRIKRWGRYEEVRVAFWRELPSLDQALELLPGEQLVVCPLFISEGYFTKTVIPTELGVNLWDNPPAIIDGRPVHYARPVGTHPKMAGVLEDGATHLLDQSGQDSASCELVLVGHGTSRDASSAKIIYAQAEALRKLERFHAVTPLFLDEEPFLEDYLEHTESKDLLVMPYFISDGLHTRWDIPAALGISRPERGFAVQAETNGRRIWYTGAIGSSWTMTDLVLERIEEALAANPIDFGPSPSPHPQRARLETGVQRLLGHVKESGTWGQLAVKQRDENLWTLCHEQERGRFVDALPKLGSAIELVSRFRLDANGNYRRNPFTSQLPESWSFSVRGESELAGTIELIYPGSILMFCDPLPEPTPLSAFAERQAGKYARLANLDARTIQEQIVGHCHAYCMLSPQWHTEASHMKEAPPCQTACPEMLDKLSKALEKTNSD